MTRKDYIRIAAALKSARPPYHAETAPRVAWDAAVFEIADVLADDNPRFDRAIFYAACGAAVDGQ
jgi:hypothetical protein